jgi:hypothetical protein
VRRSSAVDEPLTMAEDGAPAQEILNQALKEDALDDSYVRKLRISSRD